MTRSWIRLAAGMTLVAGLGACSREAPEAPPIDNVADEPTATPTPVAEPSPPPPAVTDADARDNSADLPPEQQTEPDEQTLDDATVTGFTARSHRDQPAPDEAVPADGGNQQ